MDAAGARVRADARRRAEAVSLLRLVADMAAYTARQAGNGLGPDEARRAIIEAAGELSAASEQLRHLARLASPGQRRAEAARLAGLGFGPRAIGRRLGVSERTAFRYLGR
jgi:hypothetical protein